MFATSSLAIRGMPSSGLSGDVAGKRGRTKVTGLYAENGSLSNRPLIQMPARVNLRASVCPLQKPCGRGVLVTAIWDGLVPAVRQTGSLVRC